MPIYEYRCERGHNFEELQRMTDDTLTSCTVCDAPVQRVFHPVAVHFKGSGFYATDYGKKKGAGGSDSQGEAKESKDSKASKDSKESSKESKPSESSSKSSTSSSSD